MSDYDDILKRVEKAVAAVSDEGLRKIAFEHLLRRELEQQDKRGSSEQRNEARARRQPGARPVARAPKTEAKTQLAIRERVRGLQISTDQEGLPAWDSISNLEKYLWVLQAANTNGVDGLTSAEIKFLIAEVFRENHETNQINNLKTKLKSGHVHSSSLEEDKATFRVWKILRRGIQHLESLAARARSNS